MRQPGAGQSLGSRVWSVALSLLGLVIVTNVIWALLRPLLPVVIAVGVLAAGLTVWNQRRWR